MRKAQRVLLIVASSLLLGVATPAPTRVVQPPPEKGDATPFREARQGTSRFIGYSHFIRLTPDQEQVKRVALERIPAPCCARYSIATCCCPCNLAKSVWGLSNWLIAEKGKNADQVREVVLEWFRFTSPSGHAGDACFRGGCAKPFAKDGCGGMNEERIS